MAQGSPILQGLLFEVPINSNQETFYGKFQNYVKQTYLVLFCCDRVSFCNLGWSGIGISLLSVSSESWDYGYAPPHLFYVVLG